MISKVSSVRLNYFISYDYTLVTTTKLVDFMKISFMTNLTVLPNVEKTFICKETGQL